MLRRGRHAETYTAPTRLHHVMYTDHSGENQAKIRERSGEDQGNYLVEIRAGKKKGWKDKEYRSIEGACKGRPYCIRTQNKYTIEIVNMENYISWLGDWLISTSALMTAY